MTRKYIVALYTTLRACKPADHWDANKRVQHRMDCEHIANAIHILNPAFDSARFLKDCGYPS